MKIFYILVVLLILSISNREVYSANDTVECTITNFSITGAGTKFSFDVYILRKTAPVFRMGSSSFMVEYNVPLALGSGVLTYVNPRFTAGSVSNSYDPMTCTTYPSGRVLVQLWFNFGGIGDTISRDPGFNGLGEKLATVEMDILLAVQITVQWDVLNSGVVNPANLDAFARYFGIYTGTLPVELASFTSSTSRNNVALKWTTTKETNNSGFKIERKKTDGQSGWKNLGFVQGSGTTNDTKAYTFYDNALVVGKYNYRLKQLDFNGNFEYFDLQNEVIIGVPTQFELSQNYPNPFNPSTKINFALPYDSRVNLKLYDISGKLVYTLINNELKSANYYEIDFNGSNLSSGTYFYSLQTEKNIDTKRMMLIK